MERSLIRNAPTAEILTASMPTHAQVPAGAGYAPVGSVKTHHEIYGKGQPLILIHSGLSSADMFGAILPELAKGREVIIVDLRADHCSWKCSEDI